MVEAGRSIEDSIGNKQAHGRLQDITVQSIKDTGKNPGKIAGFVCSVTE